MCDLNQIPGRWGKMHVLCLRVRWSCLLSANIDLPLGLLRADSGLWCWAGSRFGHPARVLMRCWACPGVRLWSLLSLLPADLRRADAKCVPLLYSNPPLQWVVCTGFMKALLPRSPKNYIPTCLAHQAPLQKIMQTQCMIVHERVKWCPVHLQWRYSPSVLPRANANPRV